MGEQSNNWWILLLNDSKSRYRAIKKQRRYEHLAATSQIEAIAVFAPGKCNSSWALAKHDLIKFYLVFGVLTWAVWTFSRLGLIAKLELMYLIEKERFLPCPFGNCFYDLRWANRVTRQEIYVLLNWFYRGWKLHTRIIFLVSIVLFRKAYSHYFSVLLWFSVMHDHVCFQ